MVTFRPSFQKSQQAAGGVQTWAKQRVEGVGGRKPDFACVAHVSEGRAGHHGTQACKPCLCEGRTPRSRAPFRPAQPAYPARRSPLLTLPPKAISIHS